jgi:membrane-associated phospholipid phosphatase
LRQRVAMLILHLLVLPIGARAGGGPLGIDHRWNRDDSGIWKRSNQVFLQNGGIVANIGLALWEGADSRLGRTAWQSVDSMALAGVAANVAKPIFGRRRPTETDNPNEWGKGGRSFPSGEVATITGIVTPYVLEYGHDHPAVYALELLPAYDAIARMKVRGHWQTDVLAGFAVGTASGYYAQSRDNPFILGLLPRGLMVGFKKHF